MPSLTIRHVTTYRYQRLVGFGEHRMMLRPRDSHDQKVIEATLAITPEPVSLDFVQDSFGNHVGIALFASRSKELRFESVVCVDHVPSDSARFDCVDTAMTLLVPYSEEELSELAPYIVRQTPDPDDSVGAWARQFLPVNETIGTSELLFRLSHGINQGFSYRRREAKGIQQPVETVRLGHGSCRDFALLMMEAARALGLAARFASGYLAVPLEQPDEPQSGSARGSTHAWAQIYLPCAGWVDFDPTSGSMGKRALVTVAVAHDPIDALPLFGTFMGRQSDCLGMEVEVRVMSGIPQPDAVP
jgi:transglutaminase-like putative cysteine protease